VLGGGFFFFFFFFLPMRNLFLENSNTHAGTRVRRVMGESGRTT